MLDRDKWTVKQEYQWPENYYMENDGEERLRLLREQMSKKGENNPENEIRMRLWKARYLNEKGRREGVDYYLKCLNHLSIFAGKRRSFFGKKNSKKEEKQFREIFQTEFLKQNLDREMLWYDEYMNFICFYISLCRSDKSYTNVLFHLAKISEEQFIVKLAEDLCQKTVALPAQLGMTEDFRLLAFAAEDGFLRYFPEQKAVYEQMKQKAAAEL